MIWAYISVIYSLLVSIFIVNIFYRQRNDLHLNNLETIYKEKEDIDIRKKIKTLKKIEEIRSLKRSWYEKAISTIGIAAFISMSIAVLIQAYSSNLKEIKINNLQKEMEIIEPQKKLVKEHLHIALTRLLEDSTKGYSLSKNDNKLLNWGIEELKNKTLNSKEANELYKIYFSLRNYKKASEIVEENWNLLKDNNGDDLITLSEYYYINKNILYAKKTLSSFNIHGATKNTLIRFHKLQWVLTKDKKFIKLLSRSYSLPESKVMDIVQNYQENLKEAQ